MPVIKKNVYKTTTVSTPSTSVTKCTERTQPKVCIHRGEIAGKADCVCSGAPLIYDCLKLQKRCCEAKLPESNVVIVPLDGSQAGPTVASSEIARCGEGFCEHYAG